MTPDDTTNFKQGPDTKKIQCVRCKCWFDPTDIDAFPTTDADFTIVCIRCFNILKTESEQGGTK